MKRKFSSDDDKSNKRPNTRHNKHFFIAPKELWSDEKAISKIVNDHQNRIEKGDLMRLVVCHGRQHENMIFCPIMRKLFS